MDQEAFNNAKVRTICDRRQARVLDDGNGGASGIFERQGHSVMLSTQQYAKWHVGYGMFAMWVPLVQIKTASIGDDFGGSWSKNDP
eukprot:scaffold35745_cov35-Attheya_sp.AAC.3